MIFLVLLSFSNTNINLMISHSNCQVLLFCVEKVENGMIIIVTAILQKGKLKHKEKN